MSSEPLAADYQTLIDNSQSLIIASCAENGAALASYAPFLAFENAFYVYLSQLAQHTANMLRHRQASIMFIEPEADAHNAFARRRLVLDCTVDEIARQHSAYEQLLDQMQNRLGDTLGVLRSLPDFHLLALTPSSGQYVAGFGKAFILKLDNGVLLPLTP